jgi:hypothetical protein
MDDDDDDDDEENALMRENQDQLSDHTSRIGGRVE